jgi:uncharacterized protein DUF3800
MNAPIRLPPEPRDQPSDYVWGMVCGLPEPLRSNRHLVMLKAFIDDSRMGQPPVYVLGGWVAPAKAWATFSDAWEAALLRSPRIEYFKFAEAMNFMGEFNGMSERSRDEKMGLLLHVIEEHRLLGAASIIPHELFDAYFGHHPHPDVRNPYFPSLFGLVARILNYNRAAGINQRLELFFDYQPGRGSDQMEKVRTGWELYRNTMPAEFRDLVQSHPPTFLNDRDYVALQAADLYAGWVRAVWERKLTGRPLPYWPWGNRDANIPSIVIEWTERTAAVLFDEIFGFPPVKVTFTFDRSYDPQRASVA